MAKTKKELEDIIAQQEQIIEKYKKKNKELLDDAEAAYKKSADFQHLMAVQDYYKACADANLLSSKIKRQKQLESDRSYKELLQDNITLCKKHGVEYWTGMAHMWEYNETNWLKKKIDELEATIEVQDNTIKHLRQYIGKSSAEQDMIAITSATPPKRRERPTIDEQTRRRIRKMYPEYSIRKISEAEGVSVGAVAKIVKGMAIKKKKKD